LNVETVRLFMFVYFVGVTNPLQVNHVKRIESYTVSLGVWCSCSIKAWLHCKQIAIWPTHYDITTKTASFCFRYRLEALVLRKEDADEYWCNCDAAQLGLSISWDTHVGGLSDSKQPCPKASFIQTPSLDENSPWNSHAYCLSFSQPAITNLLSWCVT